MSPHLRALQILHLAHGTHHAMTTFGDVDVFRGTLGWGEARLDLDMRTADFHGLRVHAGLLQMYREVHAPPTHATAMGGYSAGGVLAVLRAVDLVLSGRHVSRVVTVAAPRFVHPNSAPELALLLEDVAVERVYFPQDAIVHVPPHLVHHGVGVPLEDTSSSSRNLLQAHLSTTYAALLEEAVRTKRVRRARRWRDRRRPYLPRRLRRA